MNRVNEVKNLLVEHGMEEHTIALYYFGENLAGIDTLSEQLKSRNRRVDIIFIKKPLPPKAIVKIIKRDTCKEGDTSIILEKGSIFTMSKCLFREQKNNLELIEVLSVDQMLSNDFNTNAVNDGQLISGGMISIRARNGNCDALDTITVLVPIKDSCIAANKLSLWERRGKVWSKNGMIKYKIVVRNKTIYFEIKLVGCMTINFDCLIDNTSPVKVSFFNSVEGYSFKKMEMYNDCPRYYWRFKRFSNNILYIPMVQTKNETMVKVWLVNDKNNKDSLVSEFVPLNHLKHKAFGSYFGNKQNGKVPFFIFKVKERELYKKYWISKELFTKSN